MSKISSKNEKQRKRTTREKVRDWKHRCASIIDYESINRLFETSIKNNRYTIEKHRFSKHRMNITHLYSLVVLQLAEKRRMYDICHPSYYKIGELGCKDDVKVTTAFYVYIELCEERRFWDVDYKYHEDLDLIYLEAKISKDAETEIYIPWATLNDITLRYIENIQKHLQCNRFTLVLKSGESSSIFYKITEGLAKPPTPELTKELKAKSDKKSKLEREIRNNSRNLYELAKSEINE